jgi:hypothetical protein
MFFQSLDSLNDNIRDRNNYLISLTLDSDDIELNNPEVIERISKYSNTKIEWGISGSKIKAINRSFPDYDFDIVICWSQDMFMTMYGADDIMRDYILQVINTRGDKNFLIHFPEPDSREFLNVLYVATREYYDMFGYIYHPSYFSLFCDNETMEVSKLLNRYHYIGIMGLYEHRNPAYHHYNLQKDLLFTEQQNFWQVDEKNFNERKERNFDLDIPKTV